MSGHADIADRTAARRRTKRALPRRRVRAGWAGAAAVSGPVDRCGVEDGGQVRGGVATLAARSDLPVELVVDLPERPSAAIETIAYFCAAELLTNVAKHSGARHATLEAVHMPGLLRVRVSDDGSGGACLEAHGGLAGLAERVKTVDGGLQISSPPGGPTGVTVERRPTPDRTGASMRIVIAEDSAVVRAGLAEILADRGHQVVAAVGNAEDLLAAVDQHQPDVTVVDVRMPPGYTDEGLRAAIAIRRDHPKTGVLVFSQYIETRYTADLLGAASGGGAAGVGYLLKDRVADHRRVLAVLRYLQS